MTNSAMMGGAYRAKHALYSDKLNFGDILKSLPEPKLLCQPYDDAAEVNNQFFLKKLLKNKIICLNI